MNGTENLEIKSHNGVYKLRLPVKYFNKDAPPDDKEVFELLSSRAEYIIQNGGAIVLPAVRSDDGHLLFDFEYVGPKA